MEKDYARITFNFKFGGDGNGNGFFATEITENDNGKRRERCYGHDNGHDNGQRLCHREHRERQRRERCYGHDKRPTASTQRTANSKGNDNDIF
jgi:hypothetical protein